MGHTPRSTILVSEAFNGSTISNTTAETTLYSVTVKGGTLGLNGQAIIDVWARLNTTLGLLPTLTVRAYYGTAFVEPLTAITLINSMTDGPIRVRAVLGAKNSTSSQFLSCEIVEHISVALLTPQSRVYQKQGNISVNSALDQTFRITIQYSGLFTNATLQYDYANLLMRT